MKRFVMLLSFLSVLFIACTKQPQHQLPQDASVDASYADASADAG